MSAQSLLPWLVAALTAVTSVLVWGFTSGRWIQKQEEGTDTLRKRLDALELAQDEEDKVRRAIVERINADLGRLEHRIEIIKRERELSDGWLTRRLEQIEASLRDLDHRRN